MAVVAAFRKPSYPALQSVTDLRQAVVMAQLLRVFVEVALPFFASEALKPNEIRPYRPLSGLQVASANITLRMTAT